MVYKSLLLLRLFPLHVAGGVPAWGLVIDTVIRIIHLFQQRHRCGSGGDSILLTAPTMTVSALMIEIMDVTIDGVITIRRSRGVAITHR